MTSPAAILARCQSTVGNSALGARWLRPTTGARPVWAASAWRGLSFFSTPDNSGLVEEPRLVRGATRDLEAVRLIAVHRFITRPQLEELLFAGESLTTRSRQVLAWRVLGDLKREGYVRATPRQLGGISGGSSLPAYFLTASGLRVAATIIPDLPKRRPARRAAFLAPHSLITTEIELVFRRAAAIGADQRLEIWEADWQLAMRVGGRAVIPDARLAYRVGAWRNHMFIEADLGTEGTRFFARKIGRYVDLYAGGSWREFLPVWPKVVTVTLTAARAASLHRATEALLISHSPYASARLSFLFVSLDELRAGGITTPCRVANARERRPLLDFDEIAARAGQRVPAQDVPASLVHLSSPAAPSEMEKTGGSNLSNQTRHGT